MAGPQGSQEEGSPGDVVHRGQASRAGQLSREWRDGGHLATENSQHGAEDRICIMISQINQIVGYVNKYQVRDHARRQ